MFKPFSPGVAPLGCATLRRLARCVAATVVLCSAFASSNAQSSQTENLREERRVERAQQLREQQRTRDFELMRRRAQRPGARRTAAFDAPRPRLTREHKRLLEPAPELRLAHAAFLSGPHTGLIRLLPNALCGENAKIVSAAATCLDAPPIAGGGAFYSFRRHTHEGGAWSDVYLHDGAFYTGFTDTVLGLLTKLGDLPLEAVSATHPLVSEIAAFTPATDISRAREQHARIKSGYFAGKSRVASVLPAVANTTYVLRSIAYRRGDRLDSEYERADVMIAFRVVREEPDGALTLLWRELLRQKSPKLKIEKTARDDPRASN